MVAPPPVVVQPAPAPTIERTKFTQEPNPGPHAAHHYDTGIQLSPPRVIAPVGSEVILRAGVCGPDGHLRSLETVEWMIAPGSVGQFLGVGQRAGLDWLLSLNRPEKVTNTFVVGTTSNRNLRLNRGTPTCTDDIPILKGQAWVSVSSPIEGVSHVTAFAPKVFAWDVRQQTSKIYWIDAEWALPPPAVNPAGSRHTFITSVTRHTNHCPLAGWRVRYEITGGTPAGFAPDASQAIEVTTDSLGQARAEIFQLKPAAGANTVNVQIIRPAELNGDGTRLVVGSGATTKTWISPEIALRTTGPAQGTIGATLTYRMEVRNPGAQVARDVVVTDPIPQGLVQLGTNPVATLEGTNYVWRLGDLQPGETRAVEANFRADRPGTITHCASVRTGAGLSAQDCVMTAITAPTLDVSVTGPPQAVVGDQVTFTAVVTNRGPTPATGLILVDRFDAGLRHAVASSPIERDLEAIEPGQSRTVTITFQVVAPGTQCNVVEVGGQGGMKSTGSACLTAVAPAAPPPVTPPPAAPPPAAPVAPPPITATEPPPQGPKPTLSVKKTGPAQRNIGESADFVIDITNTGSVQATNLKIADNYDLSLDPVGATDGFAFAGDDLIWMVDMLPPGKTIRFQVNCKCLSRATKTCNRVTVTCQEGARDDAEACLAIGGPSTPLGLSISDLRDPVSVGNETTYEIRVSNPGQTSDRDVVLAVTVPDELTPSAVGTGGPAAGRITGQMVQFSPVPELKAGDTLTFRVLARGTRPGAARIHAEVTSANMTQPVATDENTTVVAP